jgi:hypothetical protein
MDVKQTVMTPEELMKPRYKVIADYIHSPYTAGMLVENSYSEKRKDRDNVSWFITQTSCNDGFTGNATVRNYFPEQRLKELPHLFKLLGWWEDRKIEDMPEYATWQQGFGTENKVVKFKLLPDNTISIDNCPMTASMWLPYLLPATQQEYEAYQNSLK